MKVESKDNAETQRVLRIAEKFQVHFAPVATAKIPQKVAVAKTLAKIAGKGAGATKSVFERLYFVGTTGFVAGAGAAVVAGAGRGAARAAWTVGGSLSALANRWLTCHN